jgi:dTDP-glucose pyrophosphorylase
MGKRLQTISIPPKATLRQAMQAIDLGACEIAMVVDEQGRLLGTLTDGDIRRGILSGADLEQAARNYMKEDFKSVSTLAGRAEVLDLMRASGLKQIPILDDEKKLTGLHLLGEIIGSVQRPNWAVIMAGGRGQRLRPLTDKTPKPMVRVAGRPVLERIILHLVGFGIRKIFLSVNYKSEVIESHFRDGKDLGCQIEYLRESKPMGTGGSLSLLAEQPRDPLLVLNGDLLTQFDVERMLAFHRDGGFAATLGVYEYVHKVPFGVVSLEGSRVTGLQEKPTQLWTANAGIYVLQPEVLDLVPRQTHYPITDLIADCLERGQIVGGFIITGDWMDVGWPDELARAQGREQDT